MSWPRALVRIAAIAAVAAAAVLVQDAESLGLAIAAIGSLAIERRSKR